MDPASGLTWTSDKPIRAGSRQRLLPGQRAQKAAAGTAASTPNRAARTQAVRAWNPELPFTGPAAQLYGDATYSRAKLVGTHFAGPTWEAADGSRFVGNGKTAAKAASSKPLSDIPWLSIKRAESTAAPVPGLNSGLFEPFSYVQRGDTEGGIPSANDLCDADHVDQAIQVDYKASYYFYASKAAYPVARECGEPHRAATSVAAASAKTPVKVIAQ
ncbi:MAG: DUF3455 domain-containing protein [Deltaproteobacteria bacterium]|nr:DUF3455 domain-containing protein [Deltaproteobacteria bacterium]